MEKRLQKNNVLMQMWGSFLMSIVLSIFMPWIETGYVTFYEFWTGFLVSFFASLALKLLTPIIEAGQWIATKIGLAICTVSHQLVSSFFLALMMGTVMSFLMTWWGVHNIPGYWSFFLSSWIRAYPSVLAVVYIMINISIFTGRRLLNR